LEPADEGRRVTQLLRESRLGDAQASEQLISDVYDKLHRLAAQNLRHQLLPEHGYPPEPSKRESRGSIRGRTGGCTATVPGYVPVAALG
jgi:hypothetical protein